MTTEHDKPFGSDPTSNVTYGSLPDVAASDPSQPAIETSFAPDERSLVNTNVRPPETGDRDIDSALADVASAQAEGLASRIEAGEEAQRVLQARLRDLGGA